MPEHKSITFRTPTVQTVDAGAPPSAGDDDSAWLLKVRRTQIPTAPAPPKILAGWVDGDWSDSTVAEVTPTPRRTTVQTDESLLEEEFAQNDERPRAFVTWLKVREAWLAEARPAKRALEVFNRLYELHGRLEREGESLQLYLGQGILVWAAPTGEIRYPLLLQRLHLEFDAGVPEFTIKETDQPPELLRSLLVGTVEGIAQQLQAAEDEFLKSDVDLLSTDSISGQLGRIAVVLHAGGHFAGETVPSTATTTPSISSDPVLFVQQRTQGFATALDKILEDLAHAADVAPGLARISGVDVTDIEPADKGDSTRASWEEPEDVLMTKESNPEQIRIAERLARYRNVLVQGPPGTGKTHTIANLIGHLLAQGKKVLVTAHTSKALRVLRDKVVPQLQPLCVAVLDNETESRKQLEGSVDAMVARLSSADSNTLRHEATLQATERKRLLERSSELRRSLVRARQDEYRDILIGGVGTPPSDAARFVASSAAQNAWLPGPLVPGATLPVSEQDVADLYAASHLVSPYDEKELTQWRPHLASVPAVEEFARVVEEVTKAESADRSSGAAYWEEGFADASEDELLSVAGKLHESVSLLAEAQAWRLDAIAAGEAGHTVERGTWDELIERLDLLRTKASSVQSLILDHGPVLGAAIPLAEQLTVFREIEAHLSRGGALGSVKLFVKPRWKVVILACRVGGSQPASAAHFRALRELALLAELRLTLGARWDRQVAALGGVEWKALGERPEESAQQLCQQIRRALGWFEETWEPTLRSLRAAGFLWEQFLAPQEVPPGRHMDLRRLLHAVTVALPPVVAARINTLALKRHADTLKEWARGLHPSDPTVLPASLVVHMRQAILEKAPSQYTTAFARLDSLASLQPVFERRNVLLERLRSVAPEWVAAITRRDALHLQGEPPGSPTEAWRYRQFVEELDRRAATSIGELLTQSRACESGIRAVTAHLIENLAWAAQVERTGLAERQALIGWKDLVRRIGKGTGKRAASLRVEARETLSLARDAVPVWIMPLSRVAESFDPRTTRFDVVIVDESSQCDVMGLVALYLARDVVVVGDHEQVSPSAIGQEIAEVQQLIHQHLDGIPNKTLYDGKMSLYDLARQSFGGVIKLVEHFRCVPEIIAFSNHLSYNGDIRPLRDAASSDLSPSVVAYRVDGERRAGGAKINDDEAKMVAALISSALSHPRYERETLGVVSLLGDEQALLIERLVREQVEPARLVKAQFLCGNAAQFQGDERDVMFLSMVDSSEDGPLSLRDTDMYRQRYNVAASRARNQLWVVHSLDKHVHLKAGDLRRRLIDHAEDPGALMRLIASQAAITESPFELRVLKRLASAGYRVRAQYPVGYYRIDLVVTGGGKKLAIECDGDRYHTAENLVADMQRQAILERLGWTFERIRGSAFFRNEDAALAPVFAALERMNIPKELAEPSPTDISGHVQTHADEVVAAAHIRLAAVAPE